MGIVLEEEAIMNDKLSIGSCTIEDVDLQEEHIININITITITISITTSLSWTKFK